LERSWANESQGNGENFYVHNADLTSSLQFSEVNQDMSQTTRLSDEYGTELLSPILVCKSPRPSIEVLIVDII
jgi:hypothetical protein